jgi:hypothetical protein
VRRISILIGLSLLLTAAVGATLIVTRRQAEAPPTTGEAEKQQRLQITSADPQQVQSIELLSDQRRILLEKEGGEWRIEQPAPYQLDPGAVEDLVYTFTRLQAEKLIDPSPKNLEQFGLDPPAVVGRASLSDRKLIELRLGALTPARNSYYLMKAGDRGVYTVWANHGIHLSYSIDDLRNKNLARIQKQNLRYLKIDRVGKKTIEMRRIDESILKDYPFLHTDYVLTQPYRPLQAVAMEKLPRFLSEVPVQFKIARFVDDHPQNLAAYGLDPPRAEVIVTDLGTELNLLIGEPGDESLVYARRGAGGPVFAMEGTDLRFLDVTPFELIETLVFIPSVDQVDRVDLRFQDVVHRIEILREGTKSAATRSYRVDGARVGEAEFRELYRKLVSLVVEAEAPAPPRAGQEAELELTYTLNSGEPRVYAFEFVPYDRDFLAVTENGAAEFLISRRQVEIFLGEVRPFFQEVSERRDPSDRISR